MHKQETAIRNSKLIDRFYIVYIDWMAQINKMIQKTSRIEIETNLYAIFEFASTNALNRAHGLSSKIAEKPFSFAYEIFWRRFYYIELNPKRIRNARFWEEGKRFVKS